MLRPTDDSFVKVFAMGKVLVLVSLLLCVAALVATEVPAGVVIDISPESIKEVKQFWSNFQEGSSKIQEKAILLSTYHATGYVQMKFYPDLAEFKEAVHNLRDSANENASIEESSPLLNALLNVTRGLPHNGSLQVFTGRRPADEDLTNLLLSELRDRGYQLFVVWTGKRNSQEETILKDVAQKSGGNLTYIKDTERKERIQEIAEELSRDEIYSQRGLKGESKTELLLSQQISGLDIVLKGKLMKAELVDPLGQRSDVLRSAHPQSNKSSIHVQVSTESVLPGLWTLDTRGDHEGSYDVTVRVIRKVSGTQIGNRDESSRAFGENGKAFEQVRFPEDSVEDTEFSEERITLKPHSNGTEFKITPASAQQKTVQPLSIPIIVELASGTNLEVRPGSNVALQFEVTNNQNLPVSALISARGDNVIVQNVQPQISSFQAYGTTLVQVSLNSPPNVQSGGIGTITLIVQAAGRITSRSAMVYFTTTTISDNTDPKFHYKYEGECKNHDEPTTCDSGQWSMEATIRDEDSGLLRVMSEPYGLLFRSEFIAGTKAPISVSYVASCCKPKLLIWAEDLRGNYARRNLDVYHQGLLEGEIAAIVVGVLLLILLIIVIIVVVCLVKRRNRSKMVLPRHRAGSR